MRASSPSAGWTAVVVLAVATACTRTTDAPAEQPPGRVRAATHAGSWYPGRADDLTAAIDERLGRAPPFAPEAEVIALIAPHAGLRFSGDIAAAGYAALKRATGIRRVILLGPSHHVAFFGVALPAPDVRAYATPLGELAIDRDAVESLRGVEGFAGPARAHDPEHSLELNAIFLARVLPAAAIVPLVVGRLGDPQSVAAIAARLRALVRPGDVVVVSSDFTHYGPNYNFVPFSDDVPSRLRTLLSGALEPLSRGSLSELDAHLATTHDTICGREPLRLLMELLPPNARGTEIAYDTSGAITGSFTNSVTYASVAFTHAGGWPTPEQTFQQGPSVLDDEGRATALRIARATLETFLTTREVPDAVTLQVPDNPIFETPYGTFVTLNTASGRLRGCIGSIEPHRPLWQDIRDNAIAAAVHDRRFRPVAPGELSSLSVEVSVLTPARPIPNPNAFEVGRHGIILEAGRHRAVFLPQVAPEQGWDRTTTLSQLSRKAGLGPDGWRQPAATFEVFEAQVFGEHEPMN